VQTFLQRSLILRNLDMLTPANRRKRVSPTRPPTGDDKTQRLNGPETGLQNSDPRRILYRLTNHHPAQLRKALPVNPTNAQVRTGPDRVERKRFPRTYRVGHFTAGKLSAGISIGGREAKVLSVLFGCSVSAIKSDAKVVRADAIRSSPPGNASGGIVSPSPSQL
jgi:hypothetical protein